jgi:hypothetical protein
MSRYSDPGSSRGVEDHAWREGPYMLDLFFLILTVAFFAGCLAYILGCERL